MSARKAPSEVIKKAKAGVPQDIFVQIVHKDITERENEKKKSRGLLFVDKELLEETNAEMQARKDEVFPKGLNDGTQVLRNYDSVPMVFVRVPNFKALERILVHSKVEAIFDNAVYKLP